MEEEKKEEVKEEVTVEKPRRSTKSKVITVMLCVALFCVLSMLGFVIFAGDLLFNNNEKCKIENSTTEITDKISYKSLAGTYINKDAVLPEDGKKHEDGTDFYDYFKLVIDENGTATFNNMGSHRGGYEAKGKLLIGINELVLINDNCQEMVVSTDKCTWPNCENIIRFDYKDGKIYFGEELIKK